MPATGVAAIIVLTRSTVAGTPSQGRGAQYLGEHGVGDGLGALLAGGRGGGIPSHPAFGSVGLRARIHEHQRAHPLPPAPQELEGDVPPHREPHQHHVARAQQIQQRGQVRGVRLHAVAEVRRVGLSHAPQVGSDPAPALERRDLMGPDRVVEWVPMNEERGRPVTPHLDRERNAIDGEPLELAPVAPPSRHELVELLGYRHGTAVAAHADEDELRRGDERVVGRAVRGLAHGEAGAADVCQLLLEAEHVSGIGCGVILDDGAADGRPGAGAIEDIHARSRPQHLPARPLEQAEKGRLVEVAEGIALVGVDGEQNRRHGCSQDMGWLDIAQPLGMTAGYTTPIRRWSDLQQQARGPMKPQTDYIRHAARLARKLQMDAAMGGTPQPDAEFYKTLSKALDEIAAGLELVSKAD